MKSYMAKKGGGISSLRLVEEDIPAPGQGEVLVKVKASALNFRERMIIDDGRYPLPVKASFIPLADGAGEIVALGSDAGKFRTGDRVAAVPFPQWKDGAFSPAYSRQLGGSLDGMLTGYRVFSEDEVVAIPAHLTWEEAATFPCAGVTAWNALTGGHPLLPGQTVLTMGTGGVSLFALQFAKLFGAKVIALTSSDEKAAFLKTLGANECINYTAVPAWHVEVKALTDGQGVDHIVEVGGAGTLERSFSSLHLNGQISLVGWLAKEKPLIDINIFAATVGSIRRIAAGNLKQQVEMNNAVASGKIRPQIDRVFHFDEAAAAFEYFAAGKYLGKVVIRHD